MNWTVNEVTRCLQVPSTTSIARGPGKIAGAVAADGLIVAAGMLAIGVGCAIVAELGEMAAPIGEVAEEETGGIWVGTAIPAG